MATHRHKIIKISCKHPGFVPHPEQTLKNSYHIKLQSPVAATSIYYFLACVNTTSIVTKNIQVKPSQTSLNKTQDGVFVLQNFLQM
jgi:hypothetical protein